MDLAALAAQLGQSTTTNKKATQALLPKQQKTRSYQDTAEYSELIVTLSRFQFGEHKNRWFLKYKVNYPIGAGRNKRATIKQLEAYAKDYLAANTDAKDLKYVEIDKVDEYNIHYRFNHEKWFKDNFSQRPKYKPPISLYWKYYKAFPRIILVNNYGNDLQKFVQARFEEWIEKKKSYLRHSKFRFIEKMAAKLFKFKWDYTRQRMYAHLKYSVILGSLAIYMSLFHDKDAKKGDIKAIQRKAANFGSVKKLDRYIKRLK